MLNVVIHVIIIAKEVFQVMTVDTGWLTKRKRFDVQYNHKLLDL